MDYSAFAAKNLGDFHSIGVALCRRLQLVDAAAMAFLEGYRYGLLVEARHPDTDHDGSGEWGLDLAVEGSLKV